MEEVPAVVAEPEAAVEIVTEAVIEPAVEEQVIEAAPIIEEPVEVQAAIVEEAHVAVVAEAAPIEPPTIPVEEAPALQLKQPQ